MTRKMKDSGIKWIGMIPEGWDVRKIKTLAILRTGTTPSTNKAEYFDGDIQWFTPGDFGDCLCLYSSERTLSREAVVDDIITLLPSESILVVAIGATVGKIGYLKTDGYCNQQVTAIILNESERSKYYAYWFMVCAPTIKATANYTTLPIINNSHLNETLCPYVKNINCQIRIADYLDAKCADIDALIAAKEKSNALLKEYRQSIIFEAVTKGLDPNVPMKDSGIEWIGMIPERWSVVSFKRLGEISTGSTPPKENINYWEGDIPWVSSKDMKSDFLTDSEDHINRTALQECGMKLFEKDCLLFCVRSGILRHTFPVAISLTPVTINQDIRAMTINKSMIPTYLLYYLKGINKVIVSLYQKIGATVESIEMEWLAYLPVLIPPPKEQFQIVNQLKFKCAEIDALIAANDKTISQLSEYRQSIIFEAVTGKMEVLDED